jgi:hypothetical protein
MFEKVKRKYAVSGSWFRASPIITVNIKSNKTHQS